MKKIFLIITIFFLFHPVAFAMQVINLDDNSDDDSNHHHNNNSNFFTNLGVSNPRPSAYAVAAERIRRDKETAIKQQEADTHRLQALAQAQSVQSSKPDMYTELLKLDDLRKRGLITDAEFQEQRNKLLGNQR